MDVSEATSAPKTLVVLEISAVEKLMDSCIETGDSFIVTFDRFSTADFDINMAESYVYSCASRSFDRQKFALFGLDFTESENITNWLQRKNGYEPNFVKPTRCAELLSSKLPIATSVLLALDP
jgi:hypothetical protein